MAFGGFPIWDRGLLPPGVAIGDFPIWDFGLLPPGAMFASDPPAISISRGCMAAPLFYITDGTSSVDLINSGGFSLCGWTPLLAQLKGGGSWAQSSISDGRQLVGAWYENVTETLGLRARGDSQDLLIRSVQDLERLLIKAREYFTTEWQTEPVYLVARSADETNTRYATIADYRLPQLSNPYGPPFATKFRKPEFEDVIVVLERKHWQSTVPGTGDCVEISGRTGFWANRFFGEFMPTQSDDDADTDDGAGGTIRLAATNLIMGSDAAGDSNDMGIRFRDVQIPRYATINDAFVILIAANSLANTTCNVVIYGELNVTPAVFTTYANFQGRARTVANVEWNDIAASTAGEHVEPYVPPGTAAIQNIAPIIQEIVNLATWVPGNDLVIFFQDNGSSVNATRDAASWDHLTYAEPKLIVEWYMEFGRDPTCLKEVYIANKQTQAELTHIYHWTAGPVWSANLIGEPLPFDLFPGGAGGPANGDIVYFGVDSAILGYGPFCSLVFDIETATTYGAGDSVQWQYWNGGWVNLTIVDNTTDRTDPCDENHSFEETDVASLHWEQPSDWQTSTEGPVGGVTGYWVRCVVTVGTAVGRVRQDNRDIYTITWPFVEIAQSQIAGDIAALGRIHVFCQSECNADTPNIDGYINRVIVGLRTKARSPRFCAYVNISDRQRWAVLGMTLLGTAVWADDLEAPTARCLEWIPAGIVAMANVVEIAVTEPLSQAYYGRFHVFMRYKVTAGTDGDLRARLSFYPGLYYTDPKPLYASNEWTVADFGMVTLPHLADRDPADAYTQWWTVQLENTVAAARTVHLYDLIFIPADEWIANFEDNITVTSIGGRPLDPNFHLDIDSVSTPHSQLLSSVRATASNFVADGYIPYSVGPAILQANAEQQLWFFVMRSHSYIDLPRFAEPYLACSLQVFNTWRYLSLRGNR